MDFQTFRDNFRVAAIGARDFARTFIEETLPDEMIFTVRLNCSYDRNPLSEGERVYPEDSSYQRALSLRECTEEVVLSTLWRDGAVPEWVNLSVSGETGEATLIELTTCGRFTANDDFLYHQRQGHPPFQCVGPSLPVDYQEGKRFSIYNRSECWQQRELQRVQRYGHKVWSLDLIGEEFDDRSLANLPDLPGLEILELRASPSDGSGLSKLDRYPKLRVLRIGLNGEQAFNIEHLPMLPNLTNLDITNLPPHPLNINILAQNTPSLSSLTLSSSENLIINGQCPQANFATGPVASINLTARKVTGNFLLPKHVNMLNLRLSEASSYEIEQLLESVETLQSLSLRYTPIDEALILHLRHNSRLVIKPSAKIDVALVLRLLSRFKFESLDLVDTGLEQEAVLRIAAKYPHIRILPRRV